MDQKKNFFLNDHDQDNLFVISEVTNLGSYSSSHQGLCRAAPWEAVFYKQTDQDLYRKRWSETAGLDTRMQRKRLKRKQLWFVRGMTATAAPAAWGGHPPRRLPKPQADHFLPQTHWFFWNDRCTHSMDDKNITIQIWLFPPPGTHFWGNPFLKVASVFNKKCWIFSNGPRATMFIKSMGIYLKDRSVGFLTRKPCPGFLTIKLNFNFKLLLIINNPQITHLMGGCLLKYIQIKCWCVDGIYPEKPYWIIETANGWHPHPIPVLQSHWLSTHTPSCFPPCLIFSSLSFLGWGMSNCVTLD